MEAPEISWRPLGQLFVERGLLDEARLEHALAEQATSGGRLGDKLVELGYVERSVLSRLLAMQYGVDLPVETGFGTGLLAELERRQEGEAPPQSSSPATVEKPPLRLVEPAVVSSTQTVQDAVGTHLARLEEQWAKLAAAEARVAELEQKLLDVDAGLAGLVEKVRDRDDQLAALNGTPAAKPAPRPKAATRKSRP